VNFSKFIGYLLLKAPSRCPESQHSRHGLNNNLGAVLRFCNAASPAHRVTLAMGEAMSQINDRSIFQVAAFPTGSSDLPVKRLKAARALSWAQDAAETA
jgi:hypothetical protein